MNTTRTDSPGGTRRRFVGVIVVIAMLGIGFVAGNRSQGAANKTPGGITVELRYDENTGWFEVWENGVMRSEFTATELLIEHVPDPEGWRAIGE